MAFVLARLRLALQIGAVRRSGVGGAVSYLGLWALALLGGVGGAYGVDWLDANVGGGELFVMMIFTAIFIFWVISPITVPLPNGDVIDPAALEQYPLTRGQQISGLLLGGLMGPGAVATFLVAAGPLATLDPRVGLAERATSLLAAVLFTVMCASASYAVRSLLAEAFTSRRGRDVAVVATTVILIAVYAGNHYLGSLLSAAESAATLFIDVLSWTPAGAAASLALLVSSGDWQGAGLRLLVVLALIAVALTLWAWALSRHVKGHSASAHPERATATTSRVLPLVPAMLGARRASAALGAASQQLRYFFFRSPKAVQIVTLGPVMAVMFAFWQVGSVGLPLAAAIAGLVLGYTSLLNLFGFDGRGVELTVQTGAPLSGVLRGKLLAVTTFAVPLLVAVIFVLTAVSNRWQDLTVALLAGFATLLFAYAVGAVASVLNPVDQEQPQGDRNVMLLGILGSMAVLVGVVIGMAWVWNSAAPVVPLWISAIVSLLLAAVLAVFAVRWSGAHLDRNPEKLLAAFTPR